MKVHFSMANFTEMESILLLMEEDMKVHLSMANFTEKEF